MSKLNFNYKFIRFQQQFKIIRLGRNGGREKWKERRESGEEGREREG